MTEDTERIESREFTAEVVDSLMNDRDRLIDYVHEANKEASEYLDLALLRQRERDETQAALADIAKELAAIKGYAKCTGKYGDEGAIVEIPMKTLGQLRHERDEALTELIQRLRELADARNERDEAQLDLEKAQAVARRLYHDWDARTVRSLQEIADENPWIVEEKGL